MKHHEGRCTVFRINATCKQIAILCAVVAALFLLRFLALRYDTPVPFFENRHEYLELPEFYHPAGFPLQPSDGSKPPMNVRRSPGGAWRISYYDEVLTDDITHIITTSPSGARIRIYDGRSWKYVGLSPVICSPPPKEYDIEAVLAGHFPESIQSRDGEDVAYVVIRIELRRDEKRCSTVALSAPETRENSDYDYLYNSSTGEFEIIDDSEKQIACFAHVSQMPVISGPSVVLVQSWKMVSQEMSTTEFCYIEDSGITKTVVENDYGHSTDRELFPLGRFGIVKSGDNTIAYDLVESRKLWQREIPGSWRPHRVGDLLVLAFPFKTVLIDVFSGITVWSEHPGIAAKDRSTGASY